MSGKGASGKGIMMGKIGRKRSIIALPCSILDDVNASTKVGARVPVNMITIKIGDHMV